MLYSVIVVLALTIPVSAFLCFSLGYKVGRAMREDKELPTVLSEVSRMVARCDHEELTEEQKRVDSIIKNIDAYDGTGAGQIKINRTQSGMSKL